MTHQNIYKLFSSLFPYICKGDITYFPNGKNSIRIRGIRGLGTKEQDYVFSVNNPDYEWKLETASNFIKNMKNEVK